MIFHLAEQPHWEQALHVGTYARSTRGRALDDVGFIHASSASQWPIVRRNVFGDLAEPLVLLRIDESRLASPVVDEVGVPETGELFPHVFGPINIDAVVGTTILEPPHA